MKNKKLFAILTLVCFMMTLMPVAAFAGAVDADTSYVYTVENNPTVRLSGGTATADIMIDVLDAAYGTPSATDISVWFTEEGKTEPTTALVSLTSSGGSSVTASTTQDETLGVVVLTGVTAADTYTATFQRAGVYTVHAAVGAVAAGTPISDLRHLGTEAGNSKITVRGTTNNEYVIANGTILADGDIYYDTAVPAAVSTFATITPVADGLYSTTVSLKLNKNTGVPTAPAAGAAVKGATVNIETSSANIEVSDETVVTNALGVFEFDVTALRQGNYEIYVTYGSVEAVIDVQVGASEPDYITVVKAPTTPVSIDAINTANDLDDIVRFVVTDINGNVLTGTQLDAVYVAETGAGFNTPDLTVNGFDPEAKYVTVVSKPAGSALRSADVFLAKDTVDPTYLTLDFATGVKLDVEGTYEFKVALNNGKYATVAIDVKEFKTPVAIELEYAAPAVELGGTVNASKINFVDANGVREDARLKVDLAASGYAIDTLATGGALTVKSDEKYLGSTVTVTAVSERYGLMTSATIKVVAEAAGLMFTSNTAEVNVNNSIQGVLVDAMGNRTALSNAVLDGAVAELTYIVLEKPEGAKVSVNFPTNENKLLAAGSFKMNLTSNKVGTVKVQVMAKVTNPTAGSGKVTKYYTGIGEIAFGTGEVGKSVVMSIGSNELIVGSEVETMDAKPIVQNSRTFVPFRALAEAFGATVAYDQATSSVTAELNGVKVVMTVGAPVYTVNGVEKTADVAPFISDSRTFVPVRFAAEAFGIEVVPTYNEDGSVADVLFNM